jgi:hypothetical protein
MQFFCEMSTILVCKISEAEYTRIKNYSNNITNMLRFTAESG